MIVTFFSYNHSLQVRRAIYDHIGNTPVDKDVILNDPDEVGRVKNLMQIKGSRDPSAPSRMTSLSGRSLPIVDSIVIFINPV
jgi:hypothetical protein